MKTRIIIPAEIEEKLLAHFFQNTLEQGAFLFSRTEIEGDSLSLKVSDAYFVPPEGWEVQHELYLEMRDDERAKIMKLARDQASGVIDCHSHPGSKGKVQFSMSDRTGITEFAAYAKWKLPGQPYAAMVWGETSLDAVLWRNEFLNVDIISEVIVPTNSARRVILPRGTWFVKSVASKQLKVGRLSGNRQ
jgi:hypothetical protein